MSTPIRKAIYGKLAGDMTLTSMLASPFTGFSQAIYYQQAPENALYPFVVFSKSSGVPTDTFHTPGAYESDVWLVKGIANTQTADVVESIQARLIALLNDATLSISGRALMALRRMSDTDYSEITDGESFKHCGSLFRVVHEAT